DTRDMLSLALGVNPVLDADVPGRVRIRVACYVASGKNALDRGFEALIDGDAAALVQGRTLNAGGLRKLGSRRDTESQHDEVGRYYRVVVQGQFPAVVGFRHAAEVKSNTFFLVYLLNHLANVRPQRFFERYILWSH